MGIERYVMKSAEKCIVLTSSGRVFGQKEIQRDISCIKHSIKALDA